MLAPPLSAFIDYLVNVILKQKANSAELFYDILFRIENKQKFKGRDVEIHNQEGERIRGTEMKTLYEKFCFFHGYLE